MKSAKRKLVKSAKGIFEKREKKAIVLTSVTWQAVIESGEKLEWPEDWDR